MKPINWSTDKNRTLIKERGISFEDVAFQLLRGDILDDVEHPNSEKYPNQRLFVLNIDNYVYLVPYVESNDDIFLKTVIPS